MFKPSVVAYNSGENFTDELMNIFGIDNIQVSDFYRTYDDILIDQANTLQACIAHNTPYGKVEKPYESDPITLSNELISNVYRLVYETPVLKEMPIKDKMMLQKYLVRHRSEATKKINEKWGI